MSKSRRWHRLLVLASILALCAWVFPETRAPLQSGDMIPAIIAVSIVVVVVRRLIRPR